MLQITKISVPATIRPLIIPNSKVDVHGSSDGHRVVRNDSANNKECSTNENASHTVFGDQQGDSCITEN